MPLNYLPEGYASPKLRLLAWVSVVVMVGSLAAACVDTDDGSPCSRKTEGPEAVRCANAANFERRRIPPPGHQVRHAKGLQAASDPSLRKEPSKSTSGQGAPEATSETQAKQPMATRRPPFMITERLLYQLKDETFDPPLPPTPLTRCGRRLKRAAAPNPFSTEAAHLKDYHQRVPLQKGLRLTDIRDALTVEAPRTLKFPSVESPPHAQLRFAYAVSRCAGWERRTISMVVTVKRHALPDWHRTVMLRRPTPGWTDFQVELPAQAGEVFDLELALQTDGHKPFPVSLAQLHIAGRTAPAVATQDGPHRRPRNVLLVVIDALRADLLGSSRRKGLPVLAPNLEAFIARGTYFKRAYSVSNQTRHATLAMFTSQPPTMGQFFATTWNVAGPVREAFYASRPPLLPRQFADAGWSADTIGHNRFLFAHHPMGMDHGFDRIWNDARRGVKDTPALVDRGIARLAEARNQRFFHYFNLVTPHVPYKTPEGYLEQVQRMVHPGVDGIPGDIPLEYLAEIRYLDDEFGRFVRAFDRLGLAEDTVVALVADHGEVFSRHHECRSNRQKAWCQNNHGLTLYNEEMHVPMVFIGKGIPAGRVVDIPTSLIDLAPTLLEAAGLPENPRHIGVSLLPLLQRREDAPKPSPVYGESKRLVALVQGDLKLIVHHKSSDVLPPARIGVPPIVPKEARLVQQQMRREGTYTAERPKKVGKARRKSLAKAAGRYELYNLETDPDETTNLALGAHQNDPRVAGLLKRLGEVRRYFAQRMERSRGLAGAPNDAKKGPAKVGGGAARKSDGTIHVESAFNVLLLRGGGTKHELAGTVRAQHPTHRLTCGTLRGDASCSVGDGGELHLNFVSEKAPAGVAFSSWPWDAPLAFDLTLNGRPISRADLRLGPFGVGFPGGGTHQTLDLATLRFAQALYPPRLSHQGSAALFFWRDSEPDPPATRADSLAQTTKSGSAAPVKPPRAKVPLGPEAIDIPAGGEEVSPEMRKMLQELGYSH